MPRVLAALVVVWVWFVSPGARAQYSVPSEVSSGQRVGSARSKIDAETVRGPGWEVGGSLAFLTAGESLGGETLDFTDLVYLRTHALLAIAQRLELFVGLDLLPKQPSYTDELVWQGASLGGRVRVGKRFAVYLRGEGGPMLGDQGGWLSFDSAAQYKHPLAEILFWESALGASSTHLLFDQETDQAFWLVEVMAQTGIAIRDPKGHFGAWINFAFHFPVAAGPDEDAPDRLTGRWLDPQTRVNVHIGALIAVARSVDLFLEWTILDRGDLEVPATTLPIVNGGFDQQQLIFGFMRRFGG